MRRGTAVIGQEILSLADARRLDSVKDVVIGPGQTEVVALLVDEGGLFSSSHVVPIQEVHSFGRDAVVVSRSEAIVSASDVPAINEVLERKDTLLGKRVFTETGETQGSVSDLFFEERTGRIAGLEISRGVTGDISRGRAYLPVEEILRFGPEALIVGQPAGAALESQTGGIQGALEGAKARAQDAGSTISDRAHQAGSRLSENTQQAGSRLSDGVQQAGTAVSNRAGQVSPEDRLVGRRTARDVLDDRGSVIVAGGQSVTQEHVARAKEAGRLRELTTAVARWEADLATASAGDAVDDTADKVGSLWDTFISRVSEMTDATGRRFDEERTKRRLSDIEDAIGRPVTKVILDRSDSVILDLGEIITHEAVQAAHDAGSLDSLLSSVYRGEFAFDKDEVRLGRPGSATVERATGDAPILDELGGKLEQAEEERSREADRKRVAADAERQRREEERARRATEREQRQGQRAAERQAAADEAARTR